MNQHVIKRATIVILATTAALGGLTACNPAAGGSSGSSASQPEKKTIADLTGPEIANKAVKATTSATSLTLDFDGVSDGEDMTFHMALDTKGECAGSVKTTDGTIKLIKTGATVYMKFDDAYWKAQGKDGEAAKSVIGDRWMKSKATSADAKDLASSCDLSEFLTDFIGDDTVAKKGATATVNGTPAITLTERDGAEHYTVYVATQGKPYIVKLAVKGGKEPGSALLSHFNEPVRTKAPAAKDTIDLDKLDG